MSTSPENNFLKHLSTGLKADSEAKTLEIAQLLARTIPENTVLALEGDLGAGKTTFMKGMALEWGIEGPILSPTYNLYFQYSGKTRNLVHLDAYRLQGEEDANNLLIEEFLVDPWCLAIEWPTKAACLITPQCWHLTIECTGEESRRFRLRIPEAQ